MSAGDVAGYIVTALSAIGFWTTKICHQSVVKCETVNSDIVTNIRWALKEYGSAVPTVSVSSSPFRESADRLVMLSQAMLDIRTLSGRLAVVLWVAIVMLLCTLISFVLGSTESLISLLGSQFLNLIAPLILLLMQVGLLYVAIVGERHIDKIAAKMKSDKEDYFADWSAKK